MSIAVTGAAGFIGSHLSKRLENESKTRLVLVDDFSRGKQEYLDYLGVKTRCLKTDLRDYCYVKGLFKNIDTVYHIAARIGGEQFMHGSPQIEFDAFYNNMLIDNNVLKSCVENGVKKIIFTSSASVHNTKKQYEDDIARFSEVELDFEQKPLQDIDPEGGYGWAKFNTENNLAILNQMGIKSGIARLWKSYGPCDDYSPESGQVVCSLIRKAINYPKEPFIVWGTGNNMRNLLYIDDLVDGLIRMEKYLDTHNTITVNLGGLYPVLIGNLATMIIRMSGKDITPEFDTTKSGGPKSRIGMLDKALTELEWKPTTSLEEGLKKTWEWMEHEL
jgi:nucleoside-diphosphate-sugar epimerase